MTKVTIKKRRTKHADVPSLPDGKHVKVGFPKGKGIGNDVLERAVRNHYGTSRGIPARPFLLNAMRKNKKKYTAAIKASAAKILRGEATIDSVLRKLGILAQGDVQEEITTLRTPPNAASTIKAKGSSNPLIDSGEMRSKVTYKVDG